jgi:ubiquinone/menaquinone biosynthesis C-methylase UbiE
MSEETHWEQAAKTRMGQYLTRVETEFISKTVDSSKTRLVIDIGAEAGRFSLLASNNNVTVIGIDIDAYSLRRLKQKNKDVTVIQADARKIPIKSDTCDAVFMIEVIDYIPEILDTIGECRRILKADFPLVFSFGNQSSLKAKIKGMRGKSYMHSYTKVTQCLLKQGFIISKKTGYSWLPFGRTSENFLVPLLASVEVFFMLRNIPRWSPWVMLSAKKSV